MNPELVSQVACAIVIAWGALTAVQASRSATRTGLLGSFITAAAMLLLVRLIADFGGWSGWFVYVWLLAMIVYVIGVYRSASAWPGLQWRAEDVKARRSETTNLSVSSVLALTITGALVVPGLLLG
ncbi:hypothetical protein [Brevibacterium marinum]|uniref:CDP-diglyceride synthetase n=1 Tax=Brevibacterium marinum TaxID=418643 RepID=A0A846RPD8_9MICO|nr:hypothetical protein [Brevibacterium marinum]NJC55784.1 CDP-diglyceride synthetase [Brevibacterium marinum]